MCSQVVVQCVWGVATSQHSQHLSLLVEDAREGTFLLLHPDPGNSWPSCLYLFYTSCYACFPPPATLCPGLSREGGWAPLLQHGALDPLVGGTVRVWGTLALDSRGTRANQPRCMACLSPLAFQPLLTPGAGCSV